MSTMAVEEERRKQRSTRQQRLVESMRAYPPNELDQAIAEARAVLDEGWRRRRLKAEFDALSTDDMERLLRSA
jgi:hypothetical protein